LNEFPSVRVGGREYSNYYSDSRTYIIHNVINKREGFTAISVNYSRVHVYYVRIYIILYNKVETKSAVRSNRLASVIE